MKFPLLLIGVLLCFQGAHCFYGLAANIAFGSQLSVALTSLATTLATFGTTATQVQNAILAQNLTYVINPESKYDLITVQVFGKMLQTYAIQLAAGANDTTSDPNALVTNYVAEAAVLAAYITPLTAAASNIESDFGVTIVSPILCTLPATIADLGTQFALLFASVQSLAYQAGITAAQINPLLTSAEKAAILTDLLTVQSAVTAFNVVYISILQEIQAITLGANLMYAVSNATLAKALPIIKSLNATINTFGPQFVPAVNAQNKIIITSLNSLTARLQSFAEDVITPQIGGYLIDDIVSFNLSTQSAVASIVGYFSYELPGLTSDVNFISAYAPSFLQYYVEDNIDWFGSAILYDTTGTALPCYQQNAVELNNTLVLFGNDVNQCLNETLSSMSDLYTIFNTLIGDYMGQYYYVLAYYNSCVNSAVTNSSSYSMIDYAGYCLDNSDILLYEDIGTLSFLTSYFGEFLSGYIDRFTNCISDAEQVYSNDLGYYYCDILYYCSNIYCDD